MTKALDLHLVVAPHLPPAILCHSLTHLWLQVNARKVYDEANVFAGVTANKLFAAILLGEASLQVLAA